MFIHFSPSPTTKALGKNIGKFELNLNWIKHFIESIDKIDFKNGDIVAHDGKVAFKLDFNITYNLSILLDREGKLINVFRSIAKQIEK